ncbi:hypothetical protein AMTRI_Chr02g254630 [Amborella trichopoda]
MIVMVDSMREMMTLQALNPKIRLSAWASGLYQDSLKAHMVLALRQQSPKVLIRN